MDSRMTEEFELSQEEIPVVKHYVEEMLKNCSIQDEDNWVQEFVPALQNLLARIEELPNGPILLTPEEGEGISMLAQDVVSFRAGPEGDDEEIFYNLLDKIEHDGEGGNWGTED